ncbi:MAG: hypothetical protein HY323_10840 [Betaproteobacteria bacterium]|nr:hypothetical protein [Betaproteobacteria bacterium]
MYLRHTTRRKDGKTHVYWQLVRSVRRGRKVVQETVAQLGELDAEGRARAAAWLQGKLMVAFLIEALISAGERFFPWGYPLAETASQPALSMA